MGVNIKDDWVVHDVGVRTTYLISQADDSVSHLIEVGEFLASQLLRELSPRLGALALMVEAQLKRSSRYETIASGQEVQTDDRLEH